MEATETPRSGQSRARTTAVWALLTLAGLLLVLSAFAVWVNRVALDTDEFRSTSAEFLHDDAIRSAVATRAVDELYNAVDVQEELESQLPEDFKSLSGLAAAGVRQGAYEVINRALEQQALQKVFAVAVEQSHSTLVDVLEGGGTTASTDGGVVTLDLGDIVLETADRIGIGSQVEDRLPDDVGRIEVLRSDQLDTAQDAFQLLKTLAWFLPLLALAALGSAIWVARDRRRAVRGLGIVMLVTGVVGLVAENLTGGYVVDALVADTDTRTAAGNAWDIVTELLRSSFRSLVVIGLVVILGAMLAGPGRRARDVRALLAPTLRNRAWAYGALALVALVLLATSDALDFGRLAVIVLLVTLGAVWIEAMRKQVLVEVPDRETPTAVDEARKRVAAWWKERRESYGPRATVPARPPAETGDVTARLASLAELHARGELTDDEYSSAKSLVLSGR